MCRESKLSLGEAKFKARHKRRLTVKVKQEITQKGTLGKERITSREKPKHWEIQN